MATLLVNDVTPRVQYIATSSQTVFAYPFAIFADGDLKVYQTPSGSDADDAADILTITTDYTVSGAGGTSGGNVTLVTGATAGDVITIERDIAVERTADYQNLGRFASESFNDDLDRLIMMIQQNEASLLRNLSLKKTTQVPLPFLMDEPIANYYPRIKSDLSGIAWVEVLSVGELTVSAFIQTLLDDTTASEALTTLGGAGLTTDNTFTDTNIFQATAYFAKGADIASATALTLGTDGNYFDVTGTTAITSINTWGIGTPFKLHFDGILTLTHHATDLILPGGANITTAAGDEAEFVEYASGDFRCTSYTKVDGTAVAQPDYIKLSDVKASGTDGGTFTAGAWQTRTLNTEDNDSGGHCSLATNQFTLAAGTYRIMAIAPAYLVTSHKIKLRNVTDSTDVIIGTSELANAGDAVQTPSSVSGEFTIAASKAFEIQHRCSVTRATDGYGIASSFTVSEVYTVVQLWKVA